MNNEQLAILLSKYRDLLNVAIERAEDDLPEEAMRECKTLIGTRYRRADALDPLRELAGTLDEDIEKLESQ